MMSPSTEQRHRERHSCIKRIEKAEFAARKKQPNHTILVERLVRQGVSRKVAEGFARHLDRAVKYNA